MQLELAPCFKFLRWSMCLRVCPDTFLKKGCATPSQLRFEAENWLEVKVDEMCQLHYQKPKMKRSVLGHHRAARDHTAGGHDYGVALVGGLVWCESTPEPFKHYSPQPELMALLFQHGSSQLRPLRWSTSDARGM